MNMKKSKFRPALLAIAGLAALAPGQQASALLPAVRVAIDFLPATLVRMENARVNLVNLVDPPEPDRRQLPPGPCKGNVQFYDEEGKAVGDAQGFELGAGQSASISALIPAVTPAPTNAAFGDGSVRFLRASIMVPVMRPALDACRGVRGSFEVYDTDTMGTKFTNPGVIRGFNPQPDPPG